MECAALEWRQTMLALKDNGFVFSRTDEAEYTAFNNEVKTSLSQMNQRWDEILQQGASQVAVNLPNVINIMAAISSGGTSEVLSILLCALFEQIFHARDSQIEAANGEPTPNTDAIVQELTAIKTEIDELAGEVTAVLESTEGDKVGDVLKMVESAVKTILTEHSINLYSDKEDITFRSGYLGSP
jgi:hypothetical protein